MMAPEGGWCVCCQTVAQVIPIMSLFMQLEHNLSLPPCQDEQFTSSPMLRRLFKLIRIVKVEHVNLNCGFICFFQDVNNHILFFVIHSEETK